MRRHRLKNILIDWQAFLQIVPGRSSNSISQCCTESIQPVTEEQRFSLSTAPLAQLQRQSVDLLRGSLIGSDRRGLHKPAHNLDLGLAKGRVRGFSLPALQDGATAQPGPRGLHCPSATAARGLSNDTFLRNITASTGPLVLYKENRLSGRYRKDPKQELAITALQKLFDELQGTYKTPLTSVDHTGEAKTPKSWWRGLNKLVHGNNTETAAFTQAGGIKGLYVFGGVGTGKTMLCDLLAATAPPAFKLRRLTFHEFMLEVHQELFHHQHKSDPLALVADEVAARTRVLCLDEFFVEDVGDATMLARLFHQLWQRGLVLVATSNRAPGELYQGGLQRDLFLPFISQLEDHTLVYDMNSAIDYRKLAIHQSGLYYFPSGSEDPHQILEAKFAALAAGCQQAVGPRSIQVAMGRQLHVPEASGGLCKFPFEELCGRPVAAADYSALAGAFHTLAISGVPVFTADTRPQAYRFLQLVDVLYEHTTRLLCSAAAAPADLFAHILTPQQAAQPHPELVDEGIVVDNNLGFTKDRCVSRLTEMESLPYLIKHAKLHSPQLLLALQEAESKSKEEQLRVLEGPPAA